MNNEMYLMKGKKFWHCKLANKIESKQLISIIVRVGDIANYEIDIMSVTVSPILCFSQEKALEFVAQEVQNLINQGFKEVDSIQIKEKCIGLPKINNEILIHDGVDYKRNPNQQNQHSKELGYQRQMHLQKETQPVLKKYFKKLKNQQKNMTKKKNLIENEDEIIIQDYQILKTNQSQFKVLLAETWSNQDPRGYFMSEKLDGMRAIWQDGQLYSRNGILIKVPDFFIDGWPQESLDGELWLDRSQFQTLVSIVKRQSPSYDDWVQVKYMVFDMPNVKLPFFQRFKEIQNKVMSSDNQQLQLVEHKICQGRSQLDEELKKVQSLGGEGLMLRDPNSLYERKRSKTLLKVKSYFDDEAEIIGYEEGSGKIQNNVGALKVKNKEGVCFSVGSGMTNEMRINPPSIGQFITYKFYGLTKDGKPRFPIFLRIKQQE